MTTVRAVHNAPWPQYILDATATVAARHLADATAAASGTSPMLQQPHLASRRCHRLRPAPTDPVTANAFVRLNSTTSNSRSDREPSVYTNVGCLTNL
jgi:hypothetical protein